MSGALAAAWNGNTMLLLLPPLIAYLLGQGALPFGLVCALAALWVAMHTRLVRNAETRPSQSNSSKQSTTAVQREKLGKLPAWYYFPSVERAAWLNTMLRELWPFVKSATESSLRSSVQSLLDQYKPGFLDSLTCVSQCHLACSHRVLFCRLPRRLSEADIGFETPLIAGARVVNPLVERCVCRRAFVRQQAARSHARFRHSSGAVPRDHLLLVDSVRTRIRRCRLASWSLRAKVL